MRVKPDIDKVVSRLSGQPSSLVTQITRLFLEELANAIVDDERVQLSGFGTFRLYTREGKRAPTLKLVSGSPTQYPHEVQYVVGFSKAIPFRNRLIGRRGKGADRVMEKYAVDEEVDQEKLEKAAASGCPNCGRKPEKHGKILVCPSCGSEPFEKK